MVVKVKDSKGNKLSIDSLVAKVKDKQGKSYAQSGDAMEFSDARRLPTGVLDLDYAIGGGLPKGKISLFYGKESSMKTGVALKALAEAQAEDPTAKQVILDLELTHDDPEWLANAVPYPERVVIIRADNAEDAVDKVDAILCASDVNYLLVDSLAMLATSNEIASTADKASVGGSSAAIGKMFRKATVRLTEARTEGRYPTVIFINQLRFKIGVMFGNPETQPGGMAPKHMSALTLKFYAKDSMGLTDKQGMSTEKDLPAWKEVSVTVEKKKVFTLGKKCDFMFCVVPTEDGYMPFDTPYWSRLENHLKASGLLVQDDKKQWVVPGLGSFPTLKELKATAMEDPDINRYLRVLLINTKKRQVLGDSAVLEPMPVIDQDG